MYRWDETWHRLLNWTKGQTASERLAAQILSHEGFKNLDPSHPLGGRDGKKDAICFKDNKKWIMAVYFPRNQKPFKEIRKKFLKDCKGVESNFADGLVFVTNQKLSLGQREDLQLMVKSPTEIYHLERITDILDQPTMESIRKQYLDIDMFSPISGGADISVWFHYVCGNTHNINQKARKIPLVKEVMPSDYGVGVVAIGIENKGTSSAKNIKLTIYPYEFDSNTSISHVGNPITGHSMVWSRSLSFEFANINRGEVQEFAGNFNLNIQNLSSKSDIFDEVKKKLLKWELTCDDMQPKEGIMQIR